MKKGTVPFLLVNLLFFVLCCFYFEATVGLVATLCMLQALFVFVNVPINSFVSVALLLLGLAPFSILALKGVDDVFGNNVFPVIVEEGLTISMAFALAFLVLLIVVCIMDIRKEKLKATI